MPPQLTPLADRRELLTALVACGLEAGLSHSDAVKLGVGVYQEIDVLARDESFEPLSMGAIDIIRDYALAIIRSGSTFSSFEIATRAVAAWRLSAQEFRRCNYEWQHERITKRLKTRARKREAAKALKKVESRLPASDPGDADSDSSPSARRQRPVRDRVGIGIHPLDHINPDYGLPDREAAQDIQGFDDLYRDFEEMRRMSYDRDLPGDPQPE